VINGGTVLNIVPSRCDVELEIRNLPQHDAAAIVAGIRADAAEIGSAASRDRAHLAVGAVGVEIEVTNEYPALDTPADAAVVELAATLTGERERIRVGFGTEGGLFSQVLGIPTVVCGPGSIEQAHKPDEFIAAEQMRRCDAMMEALLERLV
jgi:acetylornithine deacetylase